MSTYDFLGLLHTSLELGDIPLRLIFRQLVDLIFFDYAQRLLGVEFPLTNMPCIGGASGGHWVWWSREQSGSRTSDEVKPSWRLAGWLAGASQAGRAGEAVKRRAATARKRVEAAKMGVKKRVNSLAKYAVSRANIVMALGVVVDGLRRV